LWWDIAVDSDVHGTHKPVVPPHADGPLHTAVDPETDGNQRLPFVTNTLYLSIRTASVRPDAAVVDDSFHPRVR
jgi:hypothetical protein